MHLFSTSTRITHMTSRIFSSFWGVLLIGLLFPIVGVAQETPSPREAYQGATAPTVKEYGRPGYAKITVYVWGSADTGVWNVEKGTDLLEFVSVVSRVQMASRSPDQRVVEKLSLYRDESRQGDPYFETQIEELFSSRGSYPALQEGDILVLESQARNRFTWRDVARITGAIATLLNTYLLLERVRN